MNILITISAVIIVLSGIIYSQFSKDQVIDGQVISNQSQSSAETEESSNIQITPKPFPTTAPTTIPSPTPTEVEQNQVKSNSTLSQLKYPGAKELSKTDDTLIMESSDNPQTITNWYKEKIRSENMNTKSFVTTKANDKVLNKLSAVGNGKNVSIEISKASNSSIVTIKVIIQ